MNTSVQKKYKKFCADNKTTMKECQCYNRTDFEAYQNANAILSSGSTLQSGNECCWYVPCQFKSNITVDPDLQNAYDRISCPSVCQNIIATVNVKNVSLSNINLNNNCVGTSTDNTETTKKDISEEISNKEQASVLFQKEKEKTTTSTSTNKLSKNTLILISVSVAIVVFIIIGLIVSFTIKN